MTRAVATTKRCDGYPAPLRRGGAFAGTVLLVLALRAVPAMAQDGARVFDQHCAPCHAATAGAPTMAGPSLHRVIGRRVGGDPAFDYSTALAEAGRRGDVWDAARLEKFLADPEVMYPGLWMGGNGLLDAAARRAVAAFLQAAR